MLDLSLFLRQGYSKPEFYGDLVYKLKKILALIIFSAQFIKIIAHYKRLAITLLNYNRLHAWGQPNHGWQLCFPFKLHTGGSDFRLMTVPTKLPIY